MGSNNIMVINNNNIYQEEIGSGLYSRMADDLEAASQRAKADSKKKKNKKAVKKSAKVASAVESAA